jgi:hypothetical protein
VHVAGALEDRLAQQVLEERLTSPPSMDRARSMMFSASTVSNARTCSSISTALGVEST